MDKAKRAELIRQRFAAKAGKLRYVPLGRVRSNEPKATGRIEFQSLGFALSHRWGRTRWLESADQEPEARLGERNRGGVPALVAIAAKAPGKLVRSLGTAEELLYRRTASPR